MSLVLRAVAPNFTTTRQPAILPHLSSLSRLIPGEIRGDTDGTDNRTHDTYTH